jgi:biopolymer transport protein ExbB
MVDYFLKGGAFMYPILIALILGLIFTFERFWTLMRASINTKNFNQEINDALKSEDGIKKAIGICEHTRGPIANVVQAGLIRSHRGIEAVERAIMGTGTIEMAFLERNLVWLATVISLAPMMGFLGTVSGMVGAFDSIAKANDISPSLVAGGISEALLTTMFGLIVAIIIQFFHNFFVARIDKIVAEMEESTQEFVDVMIEKSLTK